MDIVGRKEAATAFSGKPGTGGLPRPARVQESKAGFYLVMASLLFEFGRPQDLVPGLGVIPFASLLDTLIILNVLTSGKISFDRPQTRLWIPLFLVMAIHVPLARNNFWALMTFKDMFLTFALYLGIVTYVDTQEKMLTMMKVWLGVHVVSAVNGILHGGTGVGGWMGDENDFCMAMNVVVPFAYFFMFASRGMAAKIKYSGLLGLFVLAAMTTLSRGGFFGLAAAGGYCWYRSPKKLHALLALVLVGVFMLAAAPETYWEEIASSNDEQTMTYGTGAERLYTWGIGLEMALYNPIIGVGQSNFPWTFEVYEAGGSFHGKSISGRQAHSAWVTLIAELGLAGILIIGGMLLCCWRDLKWVRAKFTPVESRGKHGQPMKVGEDMRAYLARALEGGFVGYIVSGVFISILWYPSLWILTAFVVALRNISEGEVPEPVGKGSEGCYRPPSSLPRLGVRPVRLVS